MKYFSIFLLVLLLAAGAFGTYFYLEHQKLQSQTSELEDRNSDLAFEVKRLEGERDLIARQYQEKIAKLSESKELEIDKLADAQNALVQELQSEIDKKEIEITQLADRLSVSLVDKILFPSGKAEITESGLKVLERVGNIIKNVAGKTIRVEGHTDNVPIHERLKDQYPTNWELSTSRATNVVRFLQETVGISAEKLEAVGMSEYHPVASNNTKTGRSKNRRIEISLLPDLSESNTK